MPHWNIFYFHNDKGDLKGFQTNFETLFLQVSVTIWHLSVREHTRKKKSCYKCIEKDSELMLEEAIEIAQNQDATAHQVGYMRPEFKGEPLQMEVHKLQGNRQSRASQNRQQSQKTSFQWSETRKVKEGNLFLLWSETVTSQKWVSGKEGKVLQVWEGRALRFRVQIIE